MVTTSPPCRGMLLWRSPASRSSFKLTVMMLEGAEFCACGGLPVAGGTTACWGISGAEGNTEELGLLVVGASAAGAVLVDTSSSGGSPEPGAALLSDAAGSVTSINMAECGRDM